MFRDHLKQKTKCQSTILLTHAIGKTKGFMDELMASTSSLGIADNY